MKAFFAPLLLVSIVLYAVDANCKDKNGKEVNEGCKRCGPEKRIVWTCQDSNWVVGERCGKQHLTCKQEKDCEAKCVKPED